MKKSILFIIPSLKSGGAEKSLVTLLSLFDYDKYDVDLYLFRKEGLFLNLVPPQVNIIGGTDGYNMFDGDMANALKYFISHGRLLTAINRIRYGIDLRSENGKERSVFGWKYLKSVMALPDKHYAAAVGYLEGNSICCCVDLASADKHIGWLHTDMDRLTHRIVADEPYMRRLDCLVGVSDKCCEKAQAVFKCLEGKTQTIENIVSKQIVCEMAGNDDVYKRESGETVLLTVGRLSQPKGIDNAVNACALLKKRAVNVKWYHIGVGELEAEIKELISQRDVGDCFTLLGEQSNPYPYIKYCDIYVQPSYFEGKCIAVDEAKCLEKPIVVTRYPTVADQITDGEDGIVAEISPESIAQKIELLINDDSLRQRLTKTLAQGDAGNEDEIKKLYALIEG